MARKTPTLSTRLDAASRGLSKATIAFEVAVGALDQAKDEHAVIAAEAREEAARLIALADEATAASERASRSAAKVRDLFA